jgi:MFS family permease
MLNINSLLKSYDMKLRFSNITLLYIITFLAALYFYLPIITLYYLERGLNFLEINSLEAIIIGTSALAEIPTGIIADKFGRKLSIIIALFLQLIGEVIYIFADNYMLFALVAVIAGISWAFLSGCFDAMMYDSLKKEGREKEMQKVSGLNGSFKLSAGIIGSFVGGLIARDLKLNSFIFLIIITSISVGLAFLVSFFLKEPSSEYKHTEQSPAKIFRDGINLLKTDKSLQRIVLLSIFATPFAGYLLTFYQPYFVQANVSGIWFGIALSIASLLGVLASRYAYLIERIMGVAKGTLLATLMPGIFYILMAIVFHPWVSIIVFVIARGSMNLQKPLFADYTNRHIESNNRATVLSMIGMFSGIYVALMGLIIGIVADYALHYAFIFMGSIVIIGALLLRIKERHVNLHHESV